MALLLCNARIELNFVVWRRYKRTSQGYKILLKKLSDVVTNFQKILVEW